MAWQFSALTLLLLVAAFLAAGLAVAGLLRIRAGKYPEGTKAFVAISVATCVYASSYGIQLFHADLAGKLRWWPIVWVGITALSVAWPVFVVIYTGRRRWVTVPSVAAVSVVPTATLLLAWLPWFRPLLASGFRLAENAGIQVLAFDPGLWLLLFVVYTYSLNVASLGLLAGSVLGSEGVYRRQAGLLFVVGIIPFVGSVAQVVGLSPYQWIDLTPVLFAVTTPMIAWALFRYRLLDVVPLARRRVFDEMADGVVVLDGTRRVVECNPVAGRLLGGSASLGPDGGAPLGRDADDVFESHPELLSLLDAGDGARTELRVSAPDGDGEQVYEATCSVVADGPGQPRGYVVLLHEITERVRRERTLRELHDATRGMLSAIRVEAIARRAATAGSELLEEARCRVWLTTDGGATLTPIAGAGTDDDPADRVTDDRRRRVRDAYDAGYDVTPPGSDGSLAEPDGREAGSGERVAESDGCTAGAGGPYLLSLGDHGVFELVPDEGSLSADDRSVARLLAATAEAALDRAHREHDLAVQTDRLSFLNSLLRHDVLNGMMIIEGHAELLEEHVDEDGRRHLETVRSWGDDIVDLIQRVRTVLAVIGGDASIEPRPVDLSSLLEAEVRRLRTTYPEADIEADLPGAVPVLADDLLGEVLGNLLTNAIRHNDSETPRVAVTVDVDDETATVRVADDGPGIPDDLKEKVFRRGTTAGGGSGSGFGLFFAATMLAEFGGDVHIEDNEPQGTVMVVELRRPRASEQVAQP